MICTRALSILSKRDVLSKRLRFVSTFNAQRKALQRNRAAKLDNHEQFDYLRNGIAEILAGKLNDAFFYSIAAMRGTASLAYFNHHISVCRSKSKLLERFISVHFFSEVTWLMVYKVLSLLQLLLYRGLTVLIG